MNGFCPSCERETELVHIQKVEEIYVKGEAIPINVDRFRCTECEEEFDNPAPEYDPLAAAYEEYRRRKEMVQPWQIRTFREKYSLTQKELSDLLGFGGATLSRYENGSLQDETHDTILKLAFDPHNLQRIIEEKAALLPRAKRDQILQQIRRDTESESLLLFLRARDNRTTPSLLNGGQVLDIQKVLGVVKVLTFQSRVFKTKLNKLLFYCDFKHFQQNGKSITGLSYAHLPYGPVPDQYDLLYEILLELDPALQKVEDLSQDCGGEYFVSEVDPNQAGLTLAEIQIVLNVKDHFKNFSSKRIADFSHAEPAYQATQNGEIISYAYAAQLKI